MGRFDDDAPLNSTQFSDYPDQVRHPLPSYEPSGAQSVSVDNWNDMPLGIEASLAPAFCVYNPATDELIGKTYICKVIDEETEADTYQELFVAIAPNSIPVPWAAQGDKRECGNCEKGDGEQGFQGA